MKIVVGLGNPVLRQAQDKRNYSDTRHNLGFAVLDEYVRKLDNSVQHLASNWKYEEKFKSEVLQFNYTLNANPSTLVLAKPQTYMNNSGLAMKLLADYFKIEPQDIIIVHDELDLPLGKVKIRLGGSGAGHHGVESVISSLGTDQFIRVRLGIGNLKSHSGEHKKIAFDADKFVLEPFMPGERAKVKHMVKQGIEALELLLNKGLEQAQNQFN